MQLNTSAAYVLVAPGAWDHWKPKSGAHIDPHEASRYIHSLESWTSHPSQGQATFLLTPTAVKTQSPFPVGWPWHIPPGCKVMGVPQQLDDIFHGKKTKKNGGFRRAPHIWNPHMEVIKRLVSITNVQQVGKTVPLYHWLKAVTLERMWAPWFLPYQTYTQKKMTRNQALAISSISNSSIVTFQRPCLGFHVKLKGGFSFPEDMALWWHYVSRATLGPPNAVVRGAFWGLLVKGHAGTRAGKAVPGAVEHTQLT